MKRVYVNEEWCLGCHLCEYYCAFAETGKPNMALALKHQTIRPGSMWRRKTACILPYPAATVRIPCASKAV